jgi:hypothetical protein
LSLGAEHKQQQDINVKVVENSIRTENPRKHGLIHNIQSYTKEFSCRKELQNKLGKRVSYSEEVKSFCRYLCSVDILVSQLLL